MPVGYTHDTRTRKHVTIWTPHILAIDLGKFNSVLCHFWVATRNHSVRTTPTTADDMHDAIQCQPGVTVVAEVEHTPFGI